MTMIFDLWNRLRGAPQRPPRVALSETAKRVLAMAAELGFTVSEDNRQGAPAIVLETEGRGKVHLWSSDDVVAFGKANKMI